MDPDRLRHSWRLALDQGEWLPAWFYQYLWETAPETRVMFPPGMADQRAKLIKTLGMVVANAHQVERAVPRLQKLGRDHRLYGAQPEHYDAVGQALIATLERFLGEAWTAELAGDWAEAWDVVCQVMIDAARTAEAAGEPAWWDHTVAAVEPNGEWVRLLLTPPSDFAWKGGQQIALNPNGEPGLWAEYIVHGVRTTDTDLLIVDIPCVGGDPILSALEDLQPGDLVRSGGPFDPPTRQEDHR